MTKDEVEPIVNDIGFAVKPVTFGLDWSTP